MLMERFQRLIRQRINPLFDQPYNTVGNRDFQSYCKNEVFIFVPVFQFTVGDVYLLTLRFAGALLNDFIEVVGGFAHKNPAISCSLCLAYYNLFTTVEVPAKSHTLMLPKRMDGHVAEHEFTVFSVGSICMKLCLAKDATSYKCARFDIAQTNADQWQLGVEIPFGIASTSSFIHGTSVLTLQLKRSNDKEHADEAFLRIQILSVCG
ncbi:hypothetical protein D917_04263 [Trichinella nativa]|uniref:Uncharacterized protein n=1 Tax=Trichinella nativa TaxID=6335 RepID=A0A1Y3E6D9_9BILA|nr:hypothetical protein D917_04263 [Trichinella nativa]